MADITPRTANRIANLADAREKAAVANAAKKAAPKKKVRIATFDDEIELDEDDVRGAARRDISSILGKVRRESQGGMRLFLTLLSTGELHPCKRGRDRIGTYSGRPRRILQYDNTKGKPDLLHGYSGWHHHGS